MQHLFDGAKAFRVRLHGKNKQHHLHEEIVIQYPFLEPFTYICMYCTCIHEFATVRAFQYRSHNCHQLCWISNLKWWTASTRFIGALGIFGTLRIFEVLGDLWDLAELLELRRSLEPCRSLKAPEILKPGRSRIIQWHCEGIRLLIKAFRATKTNFFSLPRMRHQLWKEGKDIYFLGLVDVIERIIKLFPHFYQWWYPLTSHL